MIHGIGTDLVAIARIEAVLARHGERFLARLLSPGERADYARLASTRGAAWLAKRWAAKEAFGKALGTGVRAPFTLAAIATASDDLGRPAFALAPRLTATLRERGIGRVHLSLSDESGHALAFVVMECADD